MKIKISKYKKTDDEYTTSESGMFNYEYLLKVINDNTFLLEYKHSLKLSFTYKLKRYNNKLLIIHNCYYIYVFLLLIGS